MTTPTTSATLEELLTCLVTEMGSSTGDLIRTKVQEVMNLADVDITALTNTINTIKTLLDSDPETEGFQTGQNIILMLTELSNRVTVLEGLSISARLDFLEAARTALIESVSAEVTRAQGVEANLQNLIDGLNSQIVTLTSQLQDLQNNYSNSCDCEAIAGQIADLQNAVSNLQAADAATATQIANLQASVSTQAGQIAALQSALAAVESTANSALAAANSANASVAALGATVSALDAREAANAAAATAAISAINTRLGANWDNLCIALAAAHSQAMTNAANGY